MTLDRILFFGGVALPTAAAIYSIVRPLLPPDIQRRLPGAGLALWTSMMIGILLIVLAALYFFADCGIAVTRC